MPPSGARDGHDAEAADALGAALVVDGVGEPAADGLVGGPAAGGDAGAGHEARGDEQGAQPGARTAAAAGGAGCVVVGGEGLAAVEELGADVVELAQLGLVAAGGGSAGKGTREWLVGGREKGEEEEEREEAWGKEGN